MGCDEIATVVPKSEDEEVNNMVIVNVHLDGLADVCDGNQLLTI